jgi:aspartyl-tRNA(Asn)/glutamyl-tRNA(Gln) amidotransferase subunit C
MNIQVNDELINHLAHLAKLEFEAGEKDAIKADLEKIIGFCEQLNQVDTEGVEPLIYMTEDTNVLRNDEVKGHLTKEEALLNAPKKDSDYFRAPKVIDKG